MPASTTGLYSVSDPWGRPIAKTKDDKLIAIGRTVAVVSGGAQVAVNVRIPDVREVEYVLHIQWETNPATYVTGIYGKKKISGNIVGMTIQGPAAGTTLTTDVIVIGPP